MLLIADLIQISWEVNNSTDDISLRGEFVPFNANSRGEADRIIHEFDLAGARSWFGSNSPDYFLVRVLWGFANNPTQNNFVREGKLAMDIGPVGTGTATSAGQSVTDSNAPLNRGGEWTLNRDHNITFDGTN